MKLLNLNVYQMEILRCKFGALQIGFPPVTLAIREPRRVFGGLLLLSWLFFSGWNGWMERFMAFGTEQINALEIIIIIHGF